jgi:hypothetical protein
LSIYPHISDEMRLGKQAMLVLLVVASSCGGEQMPSVPQPVWDECGIYARFCACAAHNRMVELGGTFTPVDLMCPADYSCCYHYGGDCRCFTEAQLSSDGITCDQARANVMAAGYTASPTCPP